VDEQRRLPDPTSRPDPYELAVQRAAQEPEPGEADGAPPLPRLQAGPFRVGPTGLLVGVVLLVGVGSLVRFGGSEAPELEVSCSTDALALSAARVRPGGLVEWTASGPDGEVVLAVGDAGDPLERAAQTLPASRLQGCRATGRFGVQAPPGPHTVTLYRAGQPVAHRDLVVTEPGDPDVG
jgi:hypothetical protein